MNTKRLDGRDETILEPELPIVDAHHHLFDLPDNRYMAEDLWSDASAGHNVVATVYCETQSFVRQSGPTWMKPIGEVEFANGAGAFYASGVYGPVRLCAGIVGHADLTLGSQVGDLLDRCLETAPDRYRGVRHVTIEFPDDRPFRYVLTYKPPPGLLERPEFSLGLAELAKRGLTFDAAIFHPSLPTLRGLIDRFTNLTFVLNHMGTAVAVEATEEMPDGVTADEKP